MLILFHLGHRISYKIARAPKKDSDQPAPLRSPFRVGAAHADGSQGSNVSSGEQWRLWPGRATITDIHIVFTQTTWTRFLVHFTQYWCIINYWMSGKYCRHCSDAAFCDIWCRSVLFVQPCLSEYIGSLRYHTLWSKIKLAGEQHFLQDYMCAQRKLRSGCASAQANQGLRCPLRIHRYL